MPDAKTVSSITALDRAQWDACFPGALETYDYLEAVEQAGIGGFQWRYIVVTEGSDLLAAAPAFLTQYRLDTTLTGPGKKIAERISCLAPGALSLRLASLGSPCTESVGVGFSPRVSASERPFVLRALLAAFERCAEAESCALLAAKDVLADDQPLWDQVTRPLGYRAIAGLPVARLAIDFPDTETYLARLSAATRKDMRRKLKALGEVRVDVRTELGALSEPVLALYRDTRARADMQFEELTGAYFSGVLSKMAGRSLCALYFVGEDLLAANLLLHDQTTLLDKFFCMAGAAGRRHNLYFLSWFTNVRLCLERGLKIYQSGQAAYENKLRLGSTLTRAAMYVRHRNTLMNRALHLAAPLFAADPTLKSGAT